MKRTFGFLLSLCAVLSAQTLTIDPSSLVFTTVPQLPASGNVTISNTGAAPVTWNITSNSSWATVAPAAGTIEAGDVNVCTVTVVADSTGNYSGELMLAHSVANQASPIGIPVSLQVIPGYQPTNRYIRDPSLAIDFIKGIAAFRRKARDNSYGGFYTSIDRQGTPITSINEKSLCGQSRLGYAFTRAFMVTGDESYLDDAHHALEFLYDHGWNNGWYMVTDLAGNFKSHWGHDDWWSFQQHYALVGIAAMVEATGGEIDWNDGSESDHSWLMRGIASNYDRLWDANEATKGYFDKSNTAWTNKWGKGFTPTVDAITTHALAMALLYDSLNHERRLVELADNITEKMTSNMAIAKAAFPENYYSDWSVDTRMTSVMIGHAYKTAWVLARAYLLNPSRTTYRSTAQEILRDLWDAGAYDTLYGGPYSLLNWQSGAIENTSKNHWMIEQCVTSGLINYYTARTREQRDLNLRVADGSMNFFMDHLMDGIYGETFTDVNRDGSSVVNGDKGGLFTAGYHSTELGYYVYLYGSLYYHRIPVQLYYKFPAENVDRSIKLTPIAIEDTALKILEVTLDGAAYSDFDTARRTIHLPPQTGGKFKVTFGLHATPPAPGDLRFSAATYSVAENGGVISLTVDRVNGSSGAVSVNYTTANGSAAAGSDYTAAAGVLTFAQDETSRTISINITDDAVYESNETFSVSLNGATGGATIGSPSIATVTIADNDAAVIPLPGRIQAENYNPGGEGVGYHDLTIGNSGGAYRTDNVDIETAHDVGGGYDVGWIKAGEWLNYNVNVASSGLYNLTARMACSGSGTKTMTVALDGATIATFSTTDGSGYQSWKNVVVNGVNLTAGNHVIRMNMLTGQFNVNYLDVFPQPAMPGALQFSSSGYSVAENGGSVTLTVNRVNGSNGAVSVNYATANGTAIAGSDYAANNGVLTFAEGVTGQTINVGISDDAVAENHETFTVTLSGATGGATIGNPSTATVTITDNDNPVDLARGKTATASSQENANYTPSKAVDGNASTRWSSAYSDPQWIRVDLGASYSIKRVVLNWERASAKNYRVDISGDGNTWTTLVTKSNMANSARIDNLTGLNGTGRYIRMYGTARTTQWGYSLFSFEAYSN